MAIEVAVALIGMAIALLLLLMLYLVSKDASEGRRRQEDLDRRLDHCGRGLVELQGLLQALEALRRDPDPDTVNVRCEELNRRIQAWNALYVPDCLPDPIPPIHCGG